VLQIQTMQQQSPFLNGKPMWTASCHFVKSFGSQPQTKPRSSSETFQPCRFTCVPSGSRKTTSCFFESRFGETPSPAFVSFCFSQSATSFSVFRSPASFFGPHHVPSHRADQGSQS
jgi:hypothetical protein